jgi:hypothetical protein
MQALSTPRDFNLERPDTWETGSFSFILSIPACERPPATVHSTKSFFKLPMVGKQAGRLRYGFPTIGKIDLTGSFS